MSVAWRLKRIDFWGIQPSFLVCTNQGNMRMLASITSTPSAFSRWRPQPPVGRRTRRWHRGASGAGQRTSRGSFFRARRTRRQQWRSWPFGAQARCQTLDLQFPTFLKHVLIKDQYIFWATEKYRWPCLKRAVKFFVNEQIFAINCYGHYNTTGNMLLWH